MSTHSFSTLLLLSASPHCGSSTIPRNCPPSRTHTTHTHSVHTYTRTCYRFLSVLCKSARNAFCTWVDLCVHCVWTKCSRTMVGRRDCGMALCMCVWTLMASHTNTHTQEMYVYFFVNLCLLCLCLFSYAGRMHRQLLSDSLFVFMSMWPYSIHRYV